MAKEYALYKGENILMIGTLQEIAEVRGVKIETLKFKLSNTYWKRIEKRIEKGSPLILIEIEEDENDEEGQAIN